VQSATRTPAAVKGTQWCSSSVGTDSVFKLDVRHSSTGMRASATCATCRGSSVQQ
jgi:hypothetical protein